mmetsp:Transcript_43672/g.86107  ORF Transcript_43672/g.86107 Transcript_43672/m.86107 type:complete len:218 (-) Transcript_43672:522-1175(-)
MLRNTSSPDDNLVENTPIGGSEPATTKATACRCRALTHSSIHRVSDRGTSTRRKPPCCRCCFVAGPRGEAAAAAAVEGGVGLKTLSCAPWNSAMAQVSTPHRTGDMADRRRSGSGSIFGGLEVSAFPDGFLTPRIMSTIIKGVPTASAMSGDGGAHAPTANPRDVEAQATNAKQEASWVRVWRGLQRACSSSPNTEATSASMGSSTIAFASTYSNPE